MEKKDKKFFEDYYVKLLNQLKAAKNDVDAQFVKDTIKDYTTQVTLGSATTNANGVSVPQYFVEKDIKNNKKFIKENESHAKKLLEGDTTADKEIKRIGRKQKFRTFKKVLIVGGVAVLIAVGVNSCNKKNKNTKGVSSSITTTTNDETSTIGITTESASVTSDTTLESDPTTNTNGTTTTFDESGAISSLSDSMSGIVIDPSTPSTKGSQTSEPTTRGTTTSETSGNTEPTTKDPTTYTTQETLPPAPTIPSTSESETDPTKKTEPSVKPTDPSYEPGPSGMPIDPIGPTDTTTTYFTWPTDEPVEPSEPSESTKKPTPKPSESETGPSGLPIDPGGPSETTETYFPIPSSDDADAPNENLSINRTYSYAMNTRIGNSQNTVDRLSSKTLVLRK